MIGLATLVAARRKPKGWPDRCHACGASWRHVWFDLALGFCCDRCGATDADE